jgi:O-antigen ligase
MIVRVTVLVRQRPLTDYDVVDPSALLGIVLVGLSVVFVFLAPYRKMTMRLVRESSLMYYALYYVACSLSFVWSIYPEFTLFRSVEMLSQLLLLCMAMYYCRDFKDAEKTFLTVAVAACLLGIAMHLKFYSFHVSITALHTNSYSAVAAITSIYCIGESFEAEPARRKRLRFWAAVFAAVMLAGTSSGSNVSFIIGLLVIALIQRTHVRWVFILLISVSMVFLYLTGTFQEFWMEILFPGKTETNIITLGGRRSMWQIYMDLIENRPFFGYGFVIISRIGAQYGTVSTTSAHNGLLEVALGTGLFGSVFILMWMYRLLREVLHSIRNRVAGVKGFVGAFVVASVNNMTLPIYGGPWNPVATIFIALIVFYVFFVSKQLDHSDKGAVSGSDNQGAVE